MNENRRSTADQDFYCDNVLSGKVPVKVVHESNKIIAFHHVKPRHKVHIMVIPKEHIGDLATLNDDKLLLEILHVVQSIAKKVRDENGACRVRTNLGEYQNNKHLHWHVTFDG